MTLEDNTEVVHSEAFIAEGKERVKVYIEKPIDGGFKSAECYLPDYQWKNIVGFSDADIAKFQEFLESTAHIIIRFAREGGFDNATNL
jgi:hypothetical protein